MTHIALPDDLVELTGETDVSGYVYGLIVLDLFRRGRLSAGKSSELLKLSRAEFMELADQHRIPIASYPPELAAQERERWDEYLRSLEAGA